MPVFVLFEEEPSITNLAEEFVAIVHRLMAFKFPFAQESL
jgi:hypothetical protein